MDASSGSIDDSQDGAGLVSAGRYHVGLAYVTGRSTLSVEGDLQPGLTSARTGTDRDVAVNARVGGMHRLNENVALGGGLFTDRSTDPASEGDAVDFYGATAGIEVSNTLRLADDEPADELLFRSVFALRYAYGWGDTSTLVADPTADVTDILVNGQSRLTVHEFALHVGSAVQF